VLAADLVHQEALQTERVSSVAKTTPHHTAKQSRRTSMITSSLRPRGPVVEVSELVGVAGVCGEEELSRFPERDGGFPRREAAWFA
jgi:hypothetical protein